MRQDVTLGKRFLAFALAFTSAMALLIASANPAYALSHTYSIAQENSRGHIYTGIAVYRYDNADWSISNDSSGCAQIEIAPIAYATQWAIFPNGQGWVEIGTGYRCQGFRYWFWGYGDSNGWHRLGVQTGLTTTARDRSLRRSPPYSWEFFIESTRKATVSYTVPPVANRVETGVESYDAFAVIPKTAFANLRYAVSDGPFVSWSGRDSFSREPGMCGEWTSDTRWLGGQHC